MAPVRTVGLLGLLLLGERALASAPAPTPTPTNKFLVARASEEAPDVTEVTDCHPHEDALFCMAGEEEVEVEYAVTNTEEYPASFTECHSHGSEMFCVDEEGEDVAVKMGEGHDEHGDEEGHDEHSDEEGGKEGQNCHFHAGVEHCVAAGESEGSAEGSEESCAKVDREYNVPLRIGLIFAVLATSSVGVFAPIFLMKFMPNKMSVLLMTLKQFGTGIIVSTAFVHLFTHSMLMFQNPCIKGLDYEGTAAAILMAGIFVSFLVEYFGQRYMRARLAKKLTNASPEGFSLEKHNGYIEMVNIHVMEAGIIFHSIIIGVTLVVSGDSFFITLFIVIVFHQFFEGLALGSRIAELGTGKHYALSGIGHHHHHGGPAAPEAQSGDESAPSIDEGKVGCSVPMWYKCVLAGAFALITPVGMAIGTGVLSHFNGNDHATSIAIGTLDAFSAGILVWVGVVEMWAGDWMGGEMSDASPLVTGLGLVGMMLGMALMSLLGKWA